MGGKGGGGGAGAMLEYGDKALDLQKQIYNENKQFIQPYYQAGTTGLNELMMRLGLGGGTAGGAKTAAQFRQELMPGYTSQSGMSGLPSGARDVSDTVLGFTTPEMKAKRAYELAGRTIVEGGNGLNYYLDGPLVGTPRFNLMGGTASSQVDNAGLDAAVQQALAGQTAQQTAAQQNPLYGSLLKSFGMEDYQADPGYQFRLSEGNKALERALASRGQFSSMNPAAAKALQDFGQQSASQEYGAAYDRYNADQGNIFNRLAAITGIGQTATGQLTGQGNQYANTATDILTGQGNAITAAQQARQANRGSMFNTLLGAGLGLATAPTTGGGSLFGSLFR